ncbi:MAG: glycoside hydrolase family 20 zincin-like fold domain-containing protein, partial [Gemmatimonadales bacterium]
MISRSLVLLAFVVAPAAAQVPLIPLPREAAWTDTLDLAGGLSITTPINRDDRFALQDFAEAMRARGVRIVPGGTAGAVRVTVARGDSSDGITAAMREEGYLLRVRDRRVEVIGGSAAGVFYGLQTLKQLVEGGGSGARLHGARIRDWPAMRWRGFHDDLSRGPVPTLEFQKKQIRTFAAYKINAYSPYFEHTLAYPADPLIAPPGGAMTPTEVRELVAYAAGYHITVIPEQEAFGHLHHVLKFETYSPLGETEHGHVLAPDNPGSLPLIQSWFAEIDSLFPGPFVHLGADETFELGRGRTAGRVASEGIGPVYLKFLSQIVAAVRRPGKRYLFWGDVAMNSPELVSSLPRDMIAVGWDYWSSGNFDRYLKPFRDAGIETWVAPGVNGWNRVYPNYSVALPNIQGFVRDGQRGGATGVLNTSWDDDGEALFNSNWYGVLFGAAAGWQPGESSIPVFQSSYGRVFHGDRSGRVDAAQRKLMAAHALLRQAGVGDANDYLFWLDPWSREGRVVTPQILPVARQVRALAESASVLLAMARRQDPLREPDALDALDLGARRIAFIGTKFLFADEVTRLYRQAADSIGTDYGNQVYNDVTAMNGRLQDLRDGYALLADLYRVAWLRENRPYWLRNVMAHYDLAIQRWLGRI